VDPRFADKNPTPPVEIPASLTPGYSGNLQVPNSNPPPSQPFSSDTDDGNRPTAAGTTSNFTSVPQRPENQNWKPTSPVGGQSVALRRPTPQQQAQQRDIVDGNPDPQISAGREVGKGIGPQGRAPGTNDEDKYPGPGAV
jgi:hypothetical protein